MVNEVKNSLPYFRSLVPNDIKVTYELDQSPYVTSALKAVVREGLLGALLTGLVVLLFLSDWRSSFIVMTTIPFALLTSVVALWLTGQTINIMTLGGLALAVGILVDEGVVEIENIDSTLQREPGLQPPRAVLHATQRTVVPRFLSMLSVVAVFLPSFLMTGVAQNLFVPLSLAVAFAMVASFLLSSSFLPVLFLWIHRQIDRSHKVLIAGRWDFDKVRDRWGAFLERLAPIRWVVLGAYVVYRVGDRSLAWAVAWPGAVPKSGRHPIPPAVGRSHGNASGENRTTGDGSSGRDSQGGGSGKRRHHPRICRHAGSKLSYQHGILVDQRTA